MLPMYKIADEMAVAKMENKLMHLISKQEKLEFEALKGFHPRMERSEAHVQWISYDVFDSGFGSSRFKKAVIRIAKENLKPNSLTGIMTVAHELGHYMDCFENFNCDTRKYNDYGTLNIEVRAWVYAIDILDSIGFGHWDDCMDFIKKTLGTYFAAADDLFSNIKPSRIKDDIAEDVAYKTLQKFMEMKMKNSWQAKLDSVLV